MRSDPRSVLTVVDLIYGAGLGSTPWPDMLVAIADLCGGENAALVLNDSNAGQSLVIAPRADPDVIAGYSTHWWQHDPTAFATQNAQPGLVTSLETTGRDHFLSSSFHNDFWRFSGLGAERLATNLVIAPGAFASCIVQMSTRRDEVGGETSELFSLLTPHLIRSVEIRRRIWRLELERSLCRQAGARVHAGLLLVDADGHLLHHDDGAEALLRSSGLLRLEQGVLRFGDLATTVSLHRLIGSTTIIRSVGSVGGTLTASDETGQSRLTLEVTPFTPGATLLDFMVPLTPGPAALIIVVDQKQADGDRHAELQRRFSLTPAEAGLALEIAKGDGRDAAAARLGISVATVRTHLSRIYEKTGVNRQAELVRLLMGL